MELNLTQKQVQTLSPQMMQSMEILQMGSQELLEYIEEAVQENPVLEPEETYDKQDEFSVLRRKPVFNFMIRWLCPIFAAIILASSVANAFGWIAM